MHTGQDRWIQNELAFTPAKNPTKPNPFKIVLLQSTRKENNWETKETLARAAVTLEMERAKWPNPWCLWWWLYSSSKTIITYNDRKYSVPCISITKLIVFALASTGVVIYVSISLHHFNNNNNNIYLLQMGCHPVAVITLHVFPNTASKFT
jgi:hypothetical protein